MSATIAKKETKLSARMGLPSRLWIWIWMVFLLTLTTITNASAADHFGQIGKNANGLSRNDFPPAFIFGVGSAAYQYEGAAAEDGRKPSIWDTFTHIKGHTADGGTGDVAVDQYHRYKEDVALMSELGVDAYRLSISWSRLIPDGRGAINPKGLQYYNNLINKLVGHGIQPYVELYHFDLPQTLEDAYGGFISPQIVEDFLAYAEVCFREFGDRVKFWTTFNEPNIFAFAGYDNGGFPPGRCSHPFGNCSAGNSTIEPYIVGHNVLLSHAAVVRLYREKYQAEQRGLIGLPLLASWYIPLTNKSTDIAAAQRMQDFSLGWFLDPLIFGDYPVGMREVVGSRLPFFTEDQTQLLRGSLDFIGINHYFTFYCFDIPRKGDSQLRDYFQDISAGIAVERDGIPITNMTSSLGAPILPQAMQALLEYIKQRYDNKPVIVYENGFPEANNDSISLSEALNDQFRIDLHHDVLQYALAAIRNGSDTRGYFIWSLLDNFELLCSYTCRFGLHYVDFKGNLERYPKLSAHWYKTFLQRSKNKKQIDGTQILSNGYNSKSISLE